jgi:hypothetical protein
MNIISAFQVLLLFPEKQRDTFHLNFLTEFYSQHCAGVACLKLGYVTTSIMWLAWQSISLWTTILAWTVPATWACQLVSNWNCSVSLSRHGRCRTMDGNRDGLTGTPRMAHSASLEATGRQESRGGGMAVVTYSVNCPTIELLGFPPLWIAQVCSRSTPTSTIRC